MDTSRESAATNVLPPSRPIHVHSINNLYFNDPITPQDLEAALEIKDPEMDDVEDLFDDDPVLHTWVLSLTFHYKMYFMLFEASASEPESPLGDSMSSSESRLSLLERILDVLALLRRHRLSPFDLVLEILGQSHPQYSSYKTEFYKEGNEKLSRILDVIILSKSGKKKLRTWVRQPTTLDLFCDVVTEEMNAIQKAELLPGIAAITPEFIRNWTVSSHQAIAPCILHILLAAAQTSTAKEKNKKKKPDVVSRYHCTIVV